MTERALICDISRYQGEVDFGRMRAAGAAGVLCRATVGDYYLDPMLERNYQESRAAGLLFGAYLVTAPADSAGRRIDAGAHLDKFFQAMQGKECQLPYTVDAELDRGCDAAWITAVNQGVARGLQQAFFPSTTLRMHPSTTPLSPAQDAPFDSSFDFAQDAAQNAPFDFAQDVAQEAHATTLGMYRQVHIYTRQSWWDRYVLSWSGWADFGLHAARYVERLAGPWSDGKFRFRDWQSWKLWQFSADGNGLGPKYGAESDDIDLNWWNGPSTTLRMYPSTSLGIHPERSRRAEPPVGVTVEERVTAIEDYLEAHTGFVPRNSPQMHADKRG